MQINYSFINIDSEPQFNNIKKSINTILKKILNNY
jgi:hypothetical protein